MKFTTDNCPYFRNIDTNLQKINSNIDNCRTRVPHASADKIHEELEKRIVIEWATEKLSKGAVRKR